MTVIDLRDVKPEVEHVRVSQMSDLGPGLLLFFARPSLLQTWAEFFGHEWRHVGITVRTEAGLMIASYGHRKCFRLDNPYEIMGSYTRVGVARIFSTDVEIAQVEAFCRRFEQLERSDSPYTFSGIMVGPVHLMARRRQAGFLRMMLLWLVAIYCWLQAIRYRDRTAFCCSTFAWAAITEVLDRPLRVPLRAHPEDEAAYATPSNRTDELLARWLCGPTELWQAISPLSRSELDLSNLGDSSDAMQAVGTDEIEAVSSSATLIILDQAPLLRAAPSGA